ncbi:MAG: hypothetical protein BWY70_01817 [Bacteroidetes bacterium ADurb.Bin408]|nr:MAG: hypothetical protein BWY70_01817 [Bacteroidetes bacterium ADurb.Bin408]
MKRQNKTQKELIYNLAEKKWQYFTRQNNQTMTCKAGKVWDTDELTIEDKRGHRYCRKIYPNIEDTVWFFEMY